MSSKIKRYNIPVFIPHEGCPHTCIFCNQKKITGVETSVTSDDAKKIIGEYLNFIPKKDRYVEVAFFGGSFTGLSIEKQKAFYEAANEYSEFVDGIRLSTRPDYINKEVLSLAKEHNVRTIELGLQSADDNVLRLNEREHKFSDTVLASNMIKESGISLGLQMMIGMYGSNPEKDYETAIRAAELNPACVRIYPTLTLKGTCLEKLYNNGDYTPYDMETAVALTDKIMRVFEDKSIEIIRVGLHSDESLTENNIAAGPYHPAFKELVLSKRRRDEIEAKVIENKISDCVYEVYPPKDRISEFVGHKRSNIEYFKEKYNIDLKITPKD